ncbi:KRBBB protein, partial [Anhinga anhinga]|nr:KRBBB protein [Anhinga anhinga]
QQDCVNRSAELLMLEDQDELDFIKEMVQKPRNYFWIGLSLPSAWKGWTWLNGSRLDQSRFQLSSGGKSSCGAIRGDTILADGCSSGLPWICQKGATQL